MAYTRNTAPLMRDFRLRWDQIQAALGKLSSSAQMRPITADDAIHPDGMDKEGECFTIGPIVLLVPKRALARSAELYVVVQGWIVFGPPLGDGDGRRTTQEFGTRAAYFLEKSGALEHVYGVHYDMDDLLPGHPVFHAQMGSQDEMRASIGDLFRVPSDGTDKVGHLLGNVRTPVAQMDAFAVITQIGADHLIATGVEKEKLEAFEALREACDFFVGAGSHLPQLSSPAATQCFRSTHWYKRTGEELTGVGAANL
jgi:hypothetical protein